MEDSRVTIRPVSELSSLGALFRRERREDDTMGVDVLASVTPHPDLHEEQVFVSELGGIPVCFAHVGTGIWASAGCGFIRHLAFRDAPRELVHETMQRVEDSLRGCDVGQMRAGAPGPTYGTFTDEGSMALLVLLQRGYRITYGNVIYELARLDDFPRVTQGDQTLTIESSPEAGSGHRSNSRILLLRSGRRIGEAWCYSAWHYGRSELRQDVFHIGDIDIVNEERGRGLGRYLLGETVFEMKKLGYRGMRLSTGVGNLRARILYASMGLTQGQTEHILMKDLLEAQNLGVSAVPIYGSPERLG